ncbi:hypothetical protein GGX14DRAFT_589590 [Mycena pura]|uniref:Uncharacterized protein n=1 Tax=Mycena pura TaxID=153505 RepID=A0AAD6YGJ8_9AGAR|nr:hypothetical protein GGX14DRAFT_589590 [Mycena pura]
MDATRPVASWIVVLRAQRDCAATLGVGIKRTPAPGVKTSARVGYRKRARARSHVRGRARARTRPWERTRTVQGGGAWCQRAARAPGVDNERGASEPVQGGSKRRPRGASRTSPRTLLGACAGAPAAWGVESGPAHAVGAWRFRAAAVQGVKNEPRTLGRRTRSSRELRVLARSRRRRRDRQHAAGASDWRRARATGGVQRATGGASGRGSVQQRAGSLAAPQTAGGRQRAVAQEGQAKRAGERDVDGGQRRGGAMLATTMWSKQMRQHLRPAGRHGTRGDSVTHRSDLIQKNLWLYSAIITASVKNPWTLMRSFTSARSRTFVARGLKTNLGISPRFWYRRVRLDEVRTLRIRAARNLGNLLGETRKQGQILRKI